jgi:hypothetical protein
MAAYHWAVVVVAALAPAEIPAHRPLAAQQMDHWAVARLQEDPQAAPRVETAIQEQAMPRAAGVASEGLVVAAAPQWAATVATEAQEVAVVVAEAPALAPQPLAALAASAAPPRSS